MSEKPRGLAAIFDTRSEFFRPLWVRLLVLAVSGGWAVVEFRNGEIIWGMIFGAFAAIGFHGFFIDPKRASANPPPDA
ncbi:MAG: DUF3329 domain-containing protein [Mesorhizobium sp.]